VVYGYDQTFKGALSSVGYLGNTTTYTYDALGRISGSTQTTASTPYTMEWAPILRQSVKAQFSSNGEKSYAIVTKNIYNGIQGSRRETAGTGRFDRRSGPRL
jgi:hypothetical protein